MLDLFDSTSCSFYGFVNEKQRQRCSWSTDWMTNKRWKNESTLSVSLSKISSSVQELLLRDIALRLEKGGFHDELSRFQHPCLSPATESQQGAQTPRGWAQRFICEGYRGYDSQDYGKASASHLAAPPRSQLACRVNLYRTTWLVATRCPPVFSQKLWGQSTVLPGTPGLKYQTSISSIRIAFHGKQDGSPWPWANTIETWMVTRAYFLASKVKTFQVQRTAAVWSPGHWAELSKVSWCQKSQHSWSISC